jgi:protocatechuate 3,4-dioxygenase, alpha subunit
MEKLRDTPSQTVGPFFAYGLTAVQYGYDYSSIADDLILGAETTADRVVITGCVYDGGGAAIPDAMIELWQVDTSGRYHDQPIQKDRVNFIGFGRLGTGTQLGSRFRFTTVKPGAIGNGQAPHINVILFMRGSLLHLYTRIYFDDEQEANGVDPLLNSVPPERKHTLVARRQQNGNMKEYRFDIHMQGEKETVFFDVKN